MLKQFMGPDGKLDRKKIQRLEALQRKACRGKGGASDLKGALRDEAFLFGTYMFDTLSPKRAIMGTFKPFLTLALVVTILAIFCFESGQYASYQLQSRFAECEAEQAYR